MKMSGKMTLWGDIRPVNFKVPEMNLFTIIFTSGVSTQIEKIDNLIERNQNFSVTPDYGKIKFVGRILKDKQSGNVAIFVFIVDEVRVARKLKESVRVD
jgi:hypothetical protein